MFDTKSQVRIRINDRDFKVNDGALIGYEYICQTMKIPLGSPCFYMTRTGVEADKLPRLAKTLDFTQKVAAEEGLFISVMDSNAVMVDK